MADGAVQSDVLPIRPIISRKYEAKDCGSGAQDRLREWEFFLRIDSIRSIPRYLG